MRYIAVKNLGGATTITLNIQGDKLEKCWHLVERHGLEETEWTHRDEALVEEIRRRRADPANQATLSLVAFAAKHARKRV